MSKSSPEPQRILQEPAFAALKHAVIERTGLSYYRDKDEALATAIVRSLDDGPWSSVGVFLAEISQPGSLRMDRLTEELTIGETFFFRHTEMFSALREHVFPDLHRRKREQRRLRIWSAGCSIGAEPYSLAILLRTDLTHLFADWNIEIVGTDINRRFLTLAREAAYDPWALRGLSPEMARRSFTRRGKKWVLQEQFREGVTFQQHNLVRDEFPSLVNSLFSLDLIVCRNVMIYFDQPTLVRLAEQFHQTLVPGGWLAVGHAEPSISLFQAFQTINTAGAILYHREDASARIPKSDGFVPITLPPARDLSPPATPPPALLPAAPPPARKLPRKSPPSSSQDHTGIIRAMANRGEVAAATEACERLLHLQPMDAALHLFHALLLEQTGQLDLAVAAVRRALYLDRGFALAHYHHGVMLQRAGRGRPAWIAWKNAEDSLRVKADDFLVEHGDGLTAGDLRSLIAMHRKSSPPAT